MRSRTANVGGLFCFSCPHREEPGGGGGFLLAGFGEIDLGQTMRLLSVSYYSAATLNVSGFPFERLKTQAATKYVDGIEQQLRVERPLDIGRLPEAVLLAGEQQVADRRPFARSASTIISV